MRTILYLLQKEFIQVFRNKAMLPIIFVMPLVQMLILVYAATMELKRVDITVVDLDLSETSSRLTAKFEASTFFHVTRAQLSPEETDKILLKGTTDVVVTFPQGFERDLKRNDQASVQILVDAINGSAADGYQFLQHENQGRDDGSAEIHPTPAGVGHPILLVQPRTEFQILHGSGGIGHFSYHHRTVSLIS